MTRPVPTGAHRTTAVIVGLLFLSSTMTFAVGNALMRAALNTDPVNTTTLIAGFIGLAYTAVAVAGIAMAMIPVLRPHTPRAARSYLVLRCLESVTILTVAGAMMFDQRLIDHYALPVYAASGAAGIVLSAALVRARLTPRPLAWLGLIGYPVLLLGTLAALLGLADLDAPTGMAFFLPGAAFEIALPALLITKGFRARDDASQIIGATTEASLSHGGPPATSAAP